MGVAAGCLTLALSVAKSLPAVVVGFALVAAVLFRFVALRHLRSLSSVKLLVRRKTPTGNLSSARLANSSMNSPPKLTSTPTTGSSATSSPVAHHPTVTRRRRR